MGNLCIIFVFVKGNHLQTMCARTCGAVILASAVVVVVAIVM